MRTPKQQSRRRKGQSGLTLIEMMVVVTIIALFTALVLPKMFRRADDARVTAARAQMSNLSTALGMYKLDTSTFPTTEQGLQALRTQPEGVPLWKGPYLPQDVPADPWGNPYVYKFPGENGDEPEIISLGADGQPGGEGINADLVNWKNK
jgi:general secretion pathway protein G